VSRVKGTDRIRASVRPAIDIGIRSNAYYMRVASGKNVPLFFCHLHKGSRSINLSTERPYGGSHGSAVHFQRFLFDALVGFEISVSAADLD
jgi:hypothetical protein